MSPFPFLVLTLLALTATSVTSLPLVSHLIDTIFKELVNQIQFNFSNGLVWEVADRFNASRIHDKVRGGHEVNGEVLYICRTTDLDDENEVLILGKLSSHHGTCSIQVSPALKDITFSEHFQVLTNPHHLPLRWIRVTDGGKFTIPPNAVHGGRINGQMYYISRKMTNDGALKPMAISAQMVPFPGYSFSSRFRPEVLYEVLTIDESIPLPAKDNWIHHSKKDRK